MNLNSKLTNFAQKELVLGYNDSERDRINSSLSQLEKVIRDRHSGEIKEIIRFGSWSRNTILPRQYDKESDVDLLVVFNTSNVKYSPGTYRNKLSATIKAAYPYSISTKDFPAVKLELNHIMFDIVPAYTEQYIIGGKSHYIPGSGDSWRTTTPNDINADLSSKNQSYGENIVRNVIRLCKHWNASANYPFESYLMEKQIIDSLFWHGDNLFEKFVSVLDNVAGNRPGVRQALDSIEKYQGGIFTQSNEPKQLEWLQRLLPGLK